MKFLRYAATAVTALALVACAPTRPAECSDPGVLDLVRSLVVRHAGAGSVLSSLNADDLREALVIEGARAVGYDEGVKKLSCEARLIARMGGVNEGQSYQLPIAYDSQILDGGEDGVYIAILPVDVIGIDGAVATWVNARKSSVAAESKEALSTHGDASTSNDESEQDSHGSVRPDDYEDAVDDEAQSGLAEPAVLAAEVSPSFNCAMASTDSERLICSDAGLANLDARMADTFRRARAAVADSKQLVAEQNAWRRDVRDLCSDVACMSQAYTDRISELSR